MRPSIDPLKLDSLLTQFLDEDVGSGDQTTTATIDPDARARGILIAQSPAVLAGIDVAAKVFSTLDGALRFQKFFEDGALLQPGARLALVEGCARPILTGERVALNLLQRLSGIATLTRTFVKAVEGTVAKIVDTRKTTPGLRLLEKYAVTCGGGLNHRFGLYDGVLIKDNHIALAGGIRAALESARRQLGPSQKIQIEVENLEQLHEAILADADAVLLDNMSPEQVRKAVAWTRRFAADKRILVEASGGITLHNVRAYAEAEVDWISVGALTHSAPAVDISLEIEK